MTKHYSFWRSRRRQRYPAAATRPMSAIRASAQLTPTSPPRMTRARL